MDLYHLYKNSINKKKMEVKPIRRKMKKMIAMVSELIGSARGLIHSRNPGLSKYSFSAQFESRSLVLEVF